jgi:peptidoglycan/xylan/chitin deacetylase (PgdA/CDA1 family)
MVALTGRQQAAEMDKTIATQKSIVGFAPRAFWPPSGPCWLIRVHKAR